jgi:arylamine N-acetyltransferase
VIEAYLSLLGVPRRAPSAAYLRELHRAHVARVPYTNAEIMLGRPGTVEPAEAVRRITAGRGGYCFALNGAFSELLRALGFTVTLHRGYVVHHDAVVDAALNHLALLVHDLPDPANPRGVWLADTGLGDALRDPLPLTAGKHRQSPFSYVLAASSRTEAGWQLRPHPAGSFVVCDIAAAPAAIGDFADAHGHLSTSAQSRFTRVFFARRRAPGGVQILRGCVLLTIDADGRREEHLALRVRWREVRAEVFGLTGDDLDELWPAAVAAHDEQSARPAAERGPAPGTGPEAAARVPAARGVAAEPRQSCA